MLTHKVSQEQKNSEQYVSFLISDALLKAMSLDLVQREVTKDKTLQAVMQFVENSRWHTISEAQSKYRKLLAFKKVRNHLTVTVTL